MRGNQVRQEDERNGRGEGWALQTGETQACARTQHLSLDNFVVSRTIGIGSSATVQLAKCRCCELLTALKTMKKKDLVDLKLVRRAFNEKTVLDLLTSPFIAEPYATFQDKTNLYLALEYVPGGEFFSLLRKRLRITPSETRFYAAEITLGLIHIHSINCAYRDLKPENVLLSASGHVKLVDFGFAKVLKNDEKTLTFCGTQEYLAPEVIENKGHTCAVDWWQLGVLIYEMRASYTPFSSDSPMDLYDHILHSQVEFPYCFDEMTKSLVSGLLQKCPGDRLRQEEIMSHPFFAEVDWGEAEQLRLEPPFVPALRSLQDTQYFFDFGKEEKGMESEIEGLDSVFLDW